MDFDKLITQNPLFIDAFREINNIGSGNAASSVAAMIGKKVDITVPSVIVEKIPNVIEKIGSPDEPAFGVQLTYEGDLDGVILLIFKENTVKTLAKLLMGMEVSEVDEMTISMIQEIGNIVSASFLNAIAMFFNVQVLPSPPSAAYDMLQALLNLALASIAAETDYALVVKTEFIIGDDTENKAEGWIVNVPSPESFIKLLKLMGLLGDEDAE